MNKNISSRSGGASKQPHRISPIGWAVILVGVYLIVAGALGGFILVLIDYFATQVTVPSWAIYPQQEILKMFFDQIQALQWLGQLNLGAFAGTTTVALGVIVAFIGRSL